MASAAPAAAGAATAPRTIGDLPESVLRRILVDSTTHSNVVRWASACAQVCPEWRRILWPTAAYSAAGLAVGPDPLDPRFIAVRGFAQQLRGFAGRAAVAEREARRGRWGGPVELLQQVAALLERADVQEHIHPNILQNMENEMESQFDLPSRHLREAEAMFGSRGHDGHVHADPPEYEHLIPWLQEWANEVEAYIKRRELGPRGRLLYDISQSLSFADRHRVLRIAYRVGRRHGFQRHSLLGEEGCVVLGAALQAMPEPLGFKELNLFDSGLTPAGLAPIIAAALRRGFAGEGLTRLNVSINNIGDAGLTTLASVLPTTLRYLTFGDTRCGTVGMRAMAAALPRLRRLQYLSCAANAHAHPVIGDAGWEALADALPQLTELATLDASSCNMGSAGGMAIAAALPRCRSTLSRLVLSYNVDLIRDESACTALEQAWGSVPGRPEVGLEMEEYDEDDY